ncbi:hypothetical protein [Bartonella sp. CB175]|uniref:hypothetical protein n=1 Tax=Bartonella sp. CB175 TaxID=3112256 RepID=UPI00300DF73C
MKKSDHIIDFSMQPKAATKQFTDAERRMLINKLTSDTQQVKTFSREKSTSSSFSIKIKDDAYHQAEQVLKQIEQSRHQ